MTNEMFGIILLAGLYVLSIMSIVLGALAYHRHRRFSDVVKVSYGCGMFVISIFFTTLWFCL